ncbi:MAG TPA: xanthine dehydrogenase family protein molybdopterin-binding subunit [Acidobacteriota bacterium]|nr:xanthine dehydrogenase family protein molybdopterin-binding subunit [Acidobacteriota bacterium]
MDSKVYIAEARGSATRQAAKAKPQAKAAPAAPPAAEVKPPDYKYIGKPTARIDGREIVTGRAKYTHDIKLRGMLIGKVLRSARAAAEIVSIDLAPALALPGVMGALKLAEGKVRYAGQQVAAVAAVDERTAEKALELIKVEYKTLPFVVDWERARDPSAPQVRDGRPNVERINEYNRGDVEKGFAEADVIVEKTYRTGFEVHNPTETHGSVAAWEGDHLVAYDSTQNIHSVRDGLARALKVPAANVTVIKNYMGGGFGSKLGVNDYTIAAANLARQTGRPVKVLLSRRDNNVCVGYRPSSAQTYKAGARKDGTLTALQLTNLASGGIGAGDDCSEPLVDIYKCPNCKAYEETVYTNTGASRAMRAPGHTQGDFGIESVMDELAAALDMDPLELRRKNYSTKNQGDTGIPYSSKGLDKCYELGAKAIGWERRNRRPGEGAGAGPVKRGLGVATSLWYGAGVPGTLADIVLYPDMSVEVICGTQDIGCGTRTHMAVVAAETLGLEPREITVKLGNSDYPWAPASGGSLTTPSVAPAVRDAALKAVERLKAVAAARLKVDAADVVMVERKFASKSDPGKSVPFADVYRDLRRETPFHGERGGMPVDQYAFNTFGAHFAEVEVDTETGHVRVLKYVAAQDSGQIVNRLTAESQVVGGVTQGLSAGLYEERVMDDTTGHPVNPNLRDYKIATSLDIPEITVLFADVVDPRINNLGVKGLGEPARVAASPAVANAVYNAIGVHVREIPMTPKRVLEALKRKESGS